MNNEYTSNELFHFLIKEVEAHFSGWDFSYLDDRQAQTPLRWSYVSEALLRVRKANAVLDMDTGGGEMFSRFAPFPPIAYATESYAPNVPIARRRLEPLGVEVVVLGEEEPRTLPFKAQMFDLILNRHGFYWPSELGRIIKPGGVFLTQQVGNCNDIGIRQLLGAPDPEPIEAWDDLPKAWASLEQAGFHILKGLEDIYPQRFYDVGAIVYQLKAVPWQIPDFTIQGYFKQLKEVHHQIELHGYVDVLEHRFFILAQMPDL